MLFSLSSRIGLFLYNLQFLIPKQMKFLILEFFDLDGVRFAHLRDPKDQSIVATAKVDDLPAVVYEILAQK